MKVNYAPFFGLCPLMLEGGVYYDDTYVEQQRNKMTKKTAVAPLKKKEAKTRTIYICFTEEDTGMEYSLKETKYWDYFIKLIVPENSERPTVNLGTITLPT